MAKQVIGIGTVANDGTGDAARTAGQKINAMIDELYNLLGDGSVLNLQNAVQGVTLAQSQVTAHQAALSIAGSQLTGTLADARITESSVTQHEAVLALAASQITDFAAASRLVVPDVNARTGDYTLILSDQNKIVSMDVAIANVLTVPLNSAVAFPVNTVIVILQIGAGQTTIIGATGVTINGISGGSVQIAARYQAINLLKTATDTWVAFGAIT